MYLAWFDADRKKPVAEKIAEARERYVEKFGAEPVVCLVNPADVVEGSAVELRPATYIGRNCFWIGVDERAEEPAAPPPAATPPASKPASLNRHDALQRPASPSCSAISATRSPGRMPASKSSTSGHSPRVRQSPGGTFKPPQQPVDPMECQDACSGGHQHQVVERGI